MAEYYPRLTEVGIRGNRLWYNDNPFYNAGYGLPNCTCYAWGRAWEIGGGTPENRPTLCTLDAEYWYNYNDGYERSQTPALGSILCLADGPYSGAGHVAVVEEIDENTGAINVSESAWGAYFFKTEWLYPPNYLPVAGFVFQGFILNPNSGGGPIPIYDKKSIILFKRRLWRIDKELLE